METPMKVVYIGATNGSGISKAGREFSICNITYGIPSQDYHSEKSKIYKKGSDVREINCTSEAFDQINFKSGDLIELILSPSPQNPQRNIVSGFKA